MKVQACSVLLPLYNGSKFIDQSFNTILASMREIDELVIVNDPLVGAFAKVIEPDRS